LSKPLILSSFPTRRSSDLRGDKRIAFPIALEQKHTKLAPTPTGLAWSKDLGGRKECISDDIKNCPFYFKKETKPENIYDDLDFRSEEHTSELQSRENLVCR